VAARGERVGAFGIGIEAEPASLEQAREAARDLSHDPRDLGVLGWRERVETK
jgi:hypothetical protein